MTSPCRNRPRFPRTAFSLLEVTIALGVFAFVLVSLLGLLPVAMQASRNALDISVAAQVADTMAERLRGGDAGTPVYFDDLGVETSEDSAVYRAEVVSGDSVSDHLLRVEIIVSRSGTEASATGRHFCYLLFDV